MSPDGFETAAREHGVRVHAFAAWLLGDAEEARDVTQEALLRLWQHHDRVVPEAARTWLLRTTRRLCVDRLRARPARTAAAPPSASAIVDAACGARAALAGDEQARLASAVAALPFRDRAAILLREVHGLGYADLAVALDMPIGSVKTVLHRARRRLRETLTALEVNE